MAIFIGLNRVFIPVGGKVLPPMDGIPNTCALRSSVPLCVGPVSECFGLRAHGLGGCCWSSCFQCWIGRALSFRLARARGSGYWCSYVFVQSSCSAVFVSGCMNHVRLFFFFSLALSRSLLLLPVSELVGLASLGPVGLSRFALCVLVCVGCGWLRQVAVGCGSRSLCRALSLSGASLFDPYLPVCFS